MSSSNPEPTPIQELIAGSVIGDLSDEERKELEMRSDEIDDADVLELQMCAASLQMAERMEKTTMDAALMDRIRIEGYRSVAGDKKASEAADVQTDTFTNNELAKSTEPAETRRRIRETMAWMSLAAALLLCLGLWNTRSTPSVSLTMVEMRSQLLSKSPSLLPLPWAEGPTPFDVSVRGDVVWDNERQEGYMRFVGMPVNDPTVEQYQLWIIDPARDEKPIDGGVFDVTNSGEVFVKIDAKLTVLDPQAFAITIEKPGGVVVSSQERLPLLAATE